MLDPQKTLGREGMLRRIRELDAQIAQHERNLREGGLVTSGRAAKAQAAALH